jgi:uncharacterized repeat protein (TIGR03847 family)
MTQVYAFEPPERFVAGTVGVPGERTFFLQARGGGRLVSVVLEKVQMSLLADKLEELLAEAQRRFGVDVPEVTIAADDNEPLDLPLDEEFRVGTLTWRGMRDRHRGHRGDRSWEYEARSRPRRSWRAGWLRVRLTRRDQAFIARAKQVVGADRPPPAVRPTVGSSGHLARATTVSPVASLSVPPGGGSTNLPPDAATPPTARSARRSTRDASNTTLRAFVTLDDARPLRLQTDQR